MLTPAAVSLRAVTFARTLTEKPVSNTEFKFMPYSLKKLKEALSISNNVGPAPAFPPNYSKEDIRYYQICSTPVICQPVPFRQDLYDADQAKVAQYPSEVQIWQEKMDAELQLTIEAITSLRKPVTVTTDANGTAQFELIKGEWYISGQFEISPGGSVMVWEDLQITVTKDFYQVNLDRFNAKGYL